MMNVARTCYSNIHNACWTGQQLMHSVKSNGHTILLLCSAKFYCSHSDTFPGKKYDKLFFVQTSMFLATFLVKENYSQ